MNTTKPLFTVLMPVYNAEKYVGQAIESVLKQTLAEFEFLIIDDGSTDGSLAIINKYAKKDQRIRVITRRNKGVSTTLNQGLKETKTNIVVRMDADDISLPERFEKQYNFLIKHPEYSIVSCQLTLVDKNGKKKHMDPKPIGDHGTKLFLGYGCAPSGATAMFKKRVVQKAGGFRQNMAAEDYACWARVAASSKDATTYYTLPESLYLYRENENGISFTRRAEQMQRTIDIGNGFRESMIEQGWPFLTFKSHKEWFNELQLINEPDARETLRIIYYKAQTWFINDLKKRSKIKALYNQAKLKVFTKIINPNNYHMIFNQPLAHRPPEA